MRALQLAGIVAGILLCGCGGSPETRPGNPPVYRRIEAATDCQTLQREFDQFQADFNRAPAGSDERELARGYMNTAETRRKQLGCR